MKDKTLLRMEEHVSAPTRKKRPRIVDLTQLGTRVCDARNACGYTQMQLAGLMGSAQGWLSELEGGKHASMEVDTVRRLADLLGVSADYLLGMSDDPTPASRRPAPRRTQQQSKHSA